MTNEVIGGKFIYNTQRDCHDLICKTCLQPERLNPEERNLMEDLGMMKIEAFPISVDYFTLCESPIPENK